MSNRAWMPLHIGDYLADTGHLTAAEHGAYLLLIMHYWQNGSLPENERLIARIARLDAEQWEGSREVIAMLFGPGWTHKRIDAEMAKADEIIEKRRRAGKARQEGSKTKSDDEHRGSTCSSHADTRAGTPFTDNLSDADASAAAGGDPRDALWRDGVSILKAMTGKTDGAARSLIGRWCRDARDDCSIVLSKIRTAQAERIGDPVSWITAALKPPGKPPPKQTVGQQARDELKRMGLLDAPDHETRHNIEGDGSPGFAGTGIARRIAIASGG